MISAEVGEETLRRISEQEIEAAIEAIADPERRMAARSVKWHTSSLSEPYPAWDVREFVDDLLELRQRATSRRYTNALYGRTPFTFSILEARDGVARAKIDLRPDDQPGKDLKGFVVANSKRCTIEIKWNDPGLAQPEIESNAIYQHFLDCCRRVLPSTVPTPLAGWTEAALMSKGLQVPVIVAGPGRLPVAHKKGECIALSEMRAVYDILQAFLS